MKAIYTEGLGERIRIMGVVYTCGQTVKSLPETMSMVYAKEKGKSLVILSLSVDAAAVISHYSLISQHRNLALWSQIRRRV
jgi:hypothetical protein